MLEVAGHAKEKEFAIERIIDIFNTGMQHKWSRRYYIDPFAGPGRCHIKGTTDEIDGSPMLAARSKFTDYFLADRDTESIAALEQRITKLALPEQTSVHYYNDDADAVVEKISGDLPPAGSSLGLAVFDPWGWDFSFDAIAKLAHGRRLDLVVNFPIAFIKRNWGKEMPQLDRFMNGNSYKAPFQAAMQRIVPGDKPARVLLDAYTSELAQIGYSYIQDHVMVENSQNLPMYYLIFASKHARGADFWGKITNRQQSGQIRMSF